VGSTVDEETTAEMPELQQEQRMARLFGISPQNVRQRPRYDRMEPGEQSTLLVDLFAASREQNEYPFCPVLFYRVQPL
jgi:hypothetical protein